jgi:hypothetical protein
MSREYVYLAFFKENKIDYIYDKELSLIEFPCISCEGIAVMSASSSKWSCTKCRKKGNLIHLINYLNSEGKFNKMYLPKEEKRSIFQLLERLAKKYPNESRIPEVKQKIKQLVNYYEKTP